MVSAPSHRVSRVPWYSGSCRAGSGFGYGALTLSGRSFQDRSPAFARSLLQSEPRGARAPVWADPLSLAATHGIDVSFSSSGYLDVSVPRVPSWQTMDSSAGDSSSSCRVSPFGHQGIYACLRLPLAFRSLPRPSSALGALASTLCSSSLDYYPETSLQFSGQLTFSLQLVFLRLVSLPVQLSRCADGFRRLSGPKP